MYVEFINRWLESAALEFLSFFICPFCVNSLQTLFVIILKALLDGYLISPYSTCNLFRCLVNLRIKHALLLFPFTLLSLLLLNHPLNLFLGLTLLPRLKQFCALRFFYCVYIFHLRFKYLLLLICFLPRTHLIIIFPIVREPLALCLLRLCTC